MAGARAITFTIDTVSAEGTTNGHHKLRWPGPPGEQLHPQGEGPPLAGTGGVLTTNIPMRSRPGQFLRLRLPGD